MRTRKGAARTQANKRLFDRAKGYVGGRRRLLRTVKETLDRAGAFAFRDRGPASETFAASGLHAYAACHERDLRHSQFIAGLKAANIELDRKSLSEIAIADPAAFDAVMAEVKAALKL